MMSPTADAGRTPTRRTTPPIETFLRVIVVSFVALILFAIPREGAVQPPLATRVIVGSGVGGQSQVRVFDGQDIVPPATPLLSFAAFTQNAGGEVRVAGCDFTADGINEIIAGTGLGTRAEVRVFNGVTGAPLGSPFLAFESGFLGGVHLACGDVTGTAAPEIMVARGALARPEVRVFSFDGVSAVQVRSFNAFEQNFFGGVRLAACDLNGDSKTEIIAGRGPLGQPQVRTFDGATGTLLGSFLAFNSSFRGGVYVACGKISGDTIPDFIATRGGLDRPEVRVFDGTNPTLVLRSFDAFISSFRGGVRVAACDLNQDGTTDILAGRGPGAQPEVRAFNGLTGTAFPAPLGSFPAFGTSFRGGVYVACSPNGSGGGPPPVDTAPTVTSTTPSDTATGVRTNSDLTITFSEPVAVTGDWFQISCPTSGPRNVTLANTAVTGGPTTWTINPNTDFAPNEICSTTIVAAQITDVDTSDPPDNMDADFTFGFTTDAEPTVSSTVPANGATGVAVDSNITVTFSESVATTASTFGLECPAGTPVSSGFVVTPAPPGNTTSYTLNPNADLPSGTCTIKVTATQVTDVDTNDPPDTMVTDFTATFTSGANNPPSFVKGPNQTVGENAPAQSVTGWATAIDDGDPAVTQLLTFNITGNNNTSLFSAGPSVSPTGDLTYTPATNQSGTALITLTLSDDGGTPGTPGDDATSPPQSFNITVNAVNNAPSFVAGPNQSVNEDSAAQSVSGWATAIDDGDPESTQALTFNVTNDNSGLFSSPPAVSATTGTLTYTPAPNAFGTANVSLTLSDNGGTANPGDDDTSDPQTFTITINAVNDAPSFVSGGNVTVLEDAGTVTTAWATAISPGPANESGQTVSFSVTNSNNALFSTQPAVAANGFLTFTTAPNANGSATVMVTAQDTGGTLNGGVDSFGPLSFTLTITAVNDPPSVTPPAAYPAHAHIIINVPDGATDLFDGSTITDVDGPGAAPFSITAAGPFPSTSGGSVTIAGNGSFSYNPPPGFTGVPSANDTFTYQICDSGVPLPSACTNATATIAVSGPRVWFVDNNAAAGGNGRLSDPFDTLTEADTAASASTDRTFVFTSGITYTSGFGFLSSEQRLIGQGVVDTNFDTALGITPPPNSAARPGINITGNPPTFTRPTINGTVTLAIGSTARGFNVNNTTAPGVSGSGATGLTVNQVSVTTTTGTAVSLTSNSGGTISFQSVSANGAPNGIVLNTTTGTFAVTGTGASGTGGTIQNTTGDGVSLNSASGVSLSFMNVNSNLGNGIRGNNVTGFTLASSVVNNNGNDAVTDESGLQFTNLLGTASITSTTISNNFEFQLQITNSTGTLTNLQMAGNTISSTGASGTIGNLFNFLGAGGGTGSMTLNVTSGTFTGNAPATATGVQCDHSGTSGTMTCNISGATFTNNNVGPQASVAGGAQVVFDFNGNTVAGNRSHGINVFADANPPFTKTITGRIRNNTVGTLGTAGSGSSLGFPIRVQNEGRIPVTLAITGNTVQESTSFTGINVNVGITTVAGSAATNATITGNTVREIDSGRAIAVQQNDHLPAGGNAGTVCTDIGSNAFSNVAGQAGDGTQIRVRRSDNSATAVFNVSQATPTAAAIANELDDANGFNNPLLVSIGGTPTFNAGACTQPP